VFSAWSVQTGYKEVFSSTEGNESSFGTPACQNMSLGAEGLNSSPVFGLSSYKITASKELGCEKKTPCVI
jgi:hypothetical protein